MRIAFTHESDRNKAYNKYKILGLNPHKHMLYCLYLDCDNKTVSQRIPCSMCDAETNKCDKHSDAYKE